MHLFHPSPPPRRPGVILLIVVIMLALFLVVGLSFMLYAESEASASRIYREAFTVNYDRADIDPQSLMNWAMGQLVYDVSDYGDGVYSAMRGHSLARNMYGWNYASANPDAQGNFTGFNNFTNMEVSPTKNLTPFNGYGKLDSTLNPPPAGMPAGTDSRQLINYTFFANPQNPAGAFIRDPERIGVRIGTGNVLDWPSKVRVDTPTTPFSGGFNVPYTYPDRNNVFLAALKANDKTGGTPRVMLPSFHRPQATPFDVPNPNTTTLTNPAPWLDTSDPSLKYKVLRPRPADMYYDGANANRSFPLPASDTGDVQNLPGGNGFDSYWMDLGYPVNVTRGGTKFKPLFAFLVVDLDNRVNLNVHGNIRGAGNTHVSNQGWGTWEVNPEHVLNGDPTDPVVTEYQKLFLGFGTANGRYGANDLPGGAGQTYPLYPYPFPPTVPPGTMLAPYVNPVDIDGVDENGNPTMRLRLPSEVTSPQYRTVPEYGTPTGYDSMVYATTNPPMRNPGMYNVLAAGRFSGSPGGNDDTPFDLAANLYYLIGQAAGPNYTRSQLFQLGLTNNLAQPRIRHMLTTLSYDLATAGARPWITDPATAPFTLQEPDPANSNAIYVPRGQQGFVQQVPSAVNPTGAIPGSDFTTDGRCQMLPRLDLNRKLTPYPRVPQFYNTNAAALGGIGSPPPAIGPTGLGIVPPVTQDPTQQLYRAIWERQQFAKEILERLVKATGAAPLPTPTAPTPQPPPEQYNALRYLAQLAVNIVDHFDDDEFMTPFYWSPWVQTDIVFGVESTKVVMNEVYAEIRNLQGEDTGANQTMFRTHFWIELFNTHMNANLPNPALNNDLDGVNRGWVRLETNAYQFNNPTPQAQGAYRIRVYKENPQPSTMRTLANVIGDPEFPGPPASNLERKCQVTRYIGGTPGVPGPEVLRTIEGNDGTAQGINGDNKRGLYVIASEDIYEMPAAPDPNNVLPTNKLPTTGTDTLSYDVPASNTIERPNHTLVLQRLACPHLPYNPPAPDPQHNPNLMLNPYVTIDYVERVQPQDAVAMEAPIVPGVPNPHTNTPYAERRSFGRAQPMTAKVAQNPNSKFTFFAPNGFPNVQSFDWVVHADRPPVSPMDLLHVSGFKPHEITQTFINATQPQPTFQHVAPWRDNFSRLYRALEYFTCGDRGMWTNIGTSVVGVQEVPSSGGRVPGKINVNTLWDKEVFMALTDPKPAGAPSPNYFNQTQVDQAWNQMNQRRARPLVLNPDSPGPEDVPFAGFANHGPLDPSAPPTPGQFPTRPGFDGTVLANGSAAGMLAFQGAQMPIHPTVVQELLAKMANNTTTRSNTFAVYLTVGFFEVMDDTVRPVRLGAEIRTRNGLPIRHKMFAIVDRTNLAVEIPPTVGGSIGLEQPNKTQFFVTSEEPVYPAEVGAGVKTTLKIVGGMSNPMLYDGKSIPLPAAFSMYADFGTHQEVLQGCAVLPNGSLQVPGFSKPHAAGFTLSYLAPGNPGPQGSIDVKDSRYSQVIPYSVIIQ